MINVFTKGSDITFVLCVAQLVFCEIGSLAHKSLSLQQGQHGTERQTNKHPVWKSQNMTDNIFIFWGCNSVKKPELHFTYQCLCEQKINKNARRFWVHGRVYNELHFHGWDVCISDLTHVRGSINGYWVKPNQICTSKHEKPLSKSASRSQGGFPYKWATASSDETAGTNWDLKNMSTSWAHQCGECVSIWS